MILTVDIGNSIITLGGFSDTEPEFVSRMATDPSLTSDEYASKILAILSLRGSVASKVEGAIIASVVPQLNTVLKGALKSLFGVDALIVGPGVKTGVPIRCDVPSTVGADLICLAVAVKELYTSPALVIDLGTVTNMVVIGDDGAFLGCAILPGISLSLDVLAEKTAQLPRVSLEVPASVIGKNTGDCMRSGILYGHAAMMDGMIDKICREYGKKLPIYVTGGFSDTVTPLLNHSVNVDVRLVLKGLYLIYKRTVK